MYAGGVLFTADFFNRSFIDNSPCLPNPKELP